jgi:hypothetical protein
MGRREEQGGSVTEEQRDGIWVQKDNQELRRRRKRRWRTEGRSLRNKAGAG